jgi:hypothetical protein
MGGFFTNAQIFEYSVKYVTSETKYRTTCNEIFFPTGIIFILSNIFIRTRETILNYKPGGY